MAGSCDPLNLGPDWATTAPAQPAEPEPAPAHELDLTDRSFGPCTRRIVIRTDGSAHDGHLYPDREAVAFLRCGSRRDAVCASCAAIYRDDAYHLMHNWLADTPAGEALVLFATFTAPSFGRVHRAEKDGTVTRCPCGGTHTADDGVAGSPINPATYRYEECATWNASVPQLWHASIKRIRRAFPDRQVDYVVVREPQKRGALHLHALVRIWAADGEVLRPGTHTAWEARFKRALLGDPDDPQFPTPVSAQSRFAEGGYWDEELARRRRFEVWLEEMMEAVTSWEDGEARPWMTDENARRVRIREAAALVGAPGARARNVARRWTLDDVLDLLDDEDDYRPSPLPAPVQNGGALIPLFYDEPAPAPRDDQPLFPALAPEDLEPVPFRPYVAHWGPQMDVGTAAR